MAEMINNATTTLLNSITDFIQFIEVGHSVATAKTYDYALRRFCHYLLQSKSADPTQLPTAQLQTDWPVAFLLWLARGQPELVIVAENTNATTESEINLTPNQVKNKNVVPKIEKTVSKSTLATYGAALSRFYKWCGTERRVQLSADEYERLSVRLKDLRGKTQRTILNKVPADEVVERLLETARKPLQNQGELQAEAKAEAETGERSQSDQARHSLIRLRNIALVETLKSTGARVGELCNLSRGDLDATNRRARVVGKGSKERWIYFSPAAWQAIDQYLSQRSQTMRQFAQNYVKLTELETAQDGEKARSGRGRARAGTNSGSQPLFARHDRGAGWRALKPLRPHAVQQMLWQLVEEAELEAYITPHKFRHWFATRVLAQTGDLATTQDLLGHASPQTTRIYAQVSEQRKQATHRQVFGE